MKTLSLCFIILLQYKFHACNEHLGGAKHEIGNKIYIPKHKRGIDIFHKKVVGHLKHPDIRDAEENVNQQPKYKMFSDYGVKSSDKKTLSIPESPYFRIENHQNGHKPPSGYSVGTIIRHKRSPHGNPKSKKQPSRQKNRNKKKNGSKHNKNVRHSPNRGRKNKKKAAKHRNKRSIPGKIVN